MTPRSFVLTGALPCALYRPHAPSAAPPCSAAASSCFVAAASSSRQATSSSGRSSKRRRGYSVVVRAAADYYEVLGVARDADKKAIKSAYRQKARKFHPVRFGCCLRDRLDMRSACATRCGLAQPAAVVRAGAAAPQRRRRTHPPKKQTPQKTKTRT